MKCWIGERIRAEIDRGVDQGILEICCCGENIGRVVGIEVGLWLG